MGIKIKKAMPEKKIVKPKEEVKPKIDLKEKEVVQIIEEPKKLFSKEDAIAQIKLNFQKGISEKQMLIEAKEKGYFEEVNDLVIETKAKMALGKSEKLVKI